jgi:anaerobic magnesium-protoporphyrin IX monomethyl ester cyclase
MGARTPSPSGRRDGWGKMTQILLGQSYFLRFDPKLWEALQPYPPLGTLYAASYLRQHEYEVALFDAMLAESEDQWANALDEHQPQYAILYEDNFNYLSKMCLLRMRAAAFKMIEMAKSRGCTVILCGADATDHYDAYLAKGADYVLIGEGEETLIELLGHLSAGEDTSQILGLATHHTQLVTRRPDISTLDKLPFPAWDLIDVEKYRSIWLKRHGYFSMNMVTTRGCPFHCNWCAKPIWGQRYHSRSPENVAAEMKWLKETYQPDHIWFADDILGLKPGWLSRFADALHAQGSLIPFKCLSRADLLSRAGEVDALARAGAQTVWMGAESGSQKILDAMDKGTRVEQIHESARRLKNAGISVGFFLQFGYPGETRDDIEKTIRLVRECDPDDIGISVSYPMPGTKFYDAVSDQLGEKQNWQDSQDLAMLYQGPFSTAFYRQLHRVVHKEFRARRAWKSLTQTSRIDSNHGAEEPLRVKKLRASMSLWLKLGYNLLTLPMARVQLDRLASSQNRLVSVPHMPHEAAATPTPQEER